MIAVVLLMLMTLFYMASNQTTARNYMDEHDQKPKRCRESLLLWMRLIFLTTLDMR